MKETNPGILQTIRRQVLERTKQIEREWKETNPGILQTIRRQVLERTKQIEREWKEELRLLKLDNIRKNTPAAFEASGGYSMKIKPYEDRTTNGLTKCIIDFLEFKGHWANRVNTRGTPDITAIIYGLGAQIEVKAGKDRIRDEQTEQGEKITQAGGHYFIAHDFHSFRQWYKQNFE